MPKPDQSPQEHTLREPAPDEQGRPTHEAGGPVPVRPRKQRERAEGRKVLRD